jgi:pimeloyl-ACP methyl ester carboxylesterase
MDEPVPLLLVPGLLCTARLWREQVTALADLAAITVTRAQREYGSLAAIAEAILAAAPARFSLAGLSMGGYVAFEILRQAPARVSRLALLNTTARPDGEERRRLREAQLRLVAGGRFLGMTEALAKSFLHPERQDDRRLVADIVAMAVEVGRDGFVRQQSAIVQRPDSRPLLPQIACPTLVLAGRQDPLLAPEVAQEMADAIPDAELVMLENCGHLSPMERPAEVNLALRRWLSEM